MIIYIRTSDTLGEEYLSLVERLSLSGRFSANPPYFCVLWIIVNIACILQSFNTINMKMKIFGCWFVVYIRIYSVKELVFVSVHLFL